jgi:hypothetical protein
MVELLPHITKSWVQSPAVTSPQKDDSSTYLKLKNMLVSDSWDEEVKMEKFKT